MGMNRKFDLIVLDVDGVLADFVGAACEAYGTTFQSLVESGKWKPGTYWVHEALGVSEKDFWKSLDEIGADFWLRAKPLPEMQDFLQIARTYADRFVVATSPPLNPVHAAGKVAWAQKYLPAAHVRDYSITPRKELYAQQGVLLIDDSPANCEKFRARGGAAILVPRYWNWLHDHGARAAGWVEDRIWTYLTAPGYLR